MIKINVMMLILINFSFAEPIGIESFKTIFDILLFFAYCDIIK